MSRKTLKITATLAAVVATAVVAPAASASSGQDLRSPDARDAHVVVVTTGQDLRSPDAADAGRPVVASNGQDLRSPDGADASRPSTAPVPSATPDNGGTDWGEIGMIAGAVALVLLGIGSVIYLTRRRGIVHKSGATPAHS
jgi:hypothetical protein